MIAQGSAHINAPSQVQVFFREYLLPILGSIALLISCVIYSTKKYFWLDEIAGWFLTTDPSLSHMLNSLIQKGDSVPPVYHLLAWTWVRIVGTTELSLRLFSSVGMCIAFFLTWRILRSTYKYWVSAIAIVTVYGLSYHLLDQNAEGRFYGLLMTFVALIALQYQALCKHHNPSRRLVLSTMLTFALIVMTHPFGFVYSGVTLLALITVDLLRHILRPRLYMLLVSSWLIFILWIGPFKLQTEIISTHMWVPVPALGDLALMYAYGFSVTLPTVLIVLCAIWIFLRLLRRKVSKPAAELVLKSTSTQGQNYLLILAGWLLLVPVFAWIISVTVSSVFVDRYMLPASLGWIIIFAHLATLLSSRWKNAYGLRETGSVIRLLRAIIAACLLTPVIYAVTHMAPLRPGTLDSSYGYTDLPIVVMSSDVYLPRTFYSTSPRRYFYIQDWDVVADKETTALNAMMDYKYLTALRDNYPNAFQNSEHIISMNTFFKTYQRFLVVREPKRRWFEARIMSNPSYKYTILGQTDAPSYLGMLDIILVYR